MDLDTQTIEKMHPVALATQVNAANHLTWEKAMSDPDANRYWEACKKELDTLSNKRDAWEIVNKKPGMKVLASRCTFRYKWYADGCMCIKCLILCMR